MAKSIKENIMGTIKFIGCILACLLLLGLNAKAFAKAYDTESITVSNTAIGFTAGTISPGDGAIPVKAVFTVETAQIRFTVDGTTPTASIGLLVQIGDIITINGQSDINAFRAIRVTSTDATIQPVYFDGL